MPNKLTCFKAYDIRGQLGTQIDENITYNIARAFGETLKPEVVVVGGDARETSEALKLAAAEGLRDAGVDVIDIGMAGTEEIYFAVSHLGIDGGIEVTASHNPIDYNGMKLVREDSKPVSADTGLFDIKAVAEAADWAETTPSKRGSYQQQTLLSEYVAHLLGYINSKNIKPLKLVVNSGNGAAGHVVDELELQFAKHGIPIEFIKVHHQPDSSFPNGIPNPLLLENRPHTADAVIEHGADMGIAWDGDFDRCFLFDEQGNFIEGYYIVGLLAEAFLQKSQGEKIIFDPRVYWNTVDIIAANNGLPVMSKTGHAFIKERMRKEDAVYGGEMSAHHYFRDFFYCDSGMIPWLLVAELLCVKGESLSALVKDRILKFPSSGEINFKVKDSDSVFERIKSYDWGETPEVGNLDGLDMVFAAWRFNIRSSNTEPLIRLNIESKGDADLVAQKLKIMESLIF